MVMVMAFCRGRSIRGNGCAVIEVEFGFCEVHLVDGRLNKLLGWDG